MQQQPASNKHGAAKWFLVSLGVIMVILALYMCYTAIFAKSLGWKETAVTSRQTIPNYCGSGVKNSSHTRPGYRYEYVVNSQTYHTDACSPSLKTVTYNPSDPQIVITSVFGSIAAASVFALIGIGALFAAWFVSR